MEQSGSNTWRGWAGFVLIWAGPVAGIAAMFALGARRLEVGAWLFVAALILLCLAPIGARLTRGTNVSNAAAVQRRRHRVETSAPTHVSDVVWTLLAFLSLVWLCATVATLVRLTLDGALGFSELETSTVTWWFYPLFAILVLMKVLFGILSIVLPWTMLMGCWRRTKWGSDLASFEAAENAAVTPTTSMPVKTGVALLAVAVVAFAAVTIALVMQAHELLP